MGAHDHRFHVVVSSRYENIDLVQTLLAEILEAVEASEQERHWIDLALREALANAIKHGNEGDPQKSVRVDGWVVNNEVCIEVRDQGEGFTPSAVEDPLAPENLLSPSGRGLLYIRNAVDSVDLAPHPEGGTVVTLRKSLGGADKAPGASDSSTGS